MMRVTAEATYTGKWWVVVVPEVDGALTQTRRLDQVEAMVQDAVSLLEEIPAEDVQVHVQPMLDVSLDADLNDLHLLWTEAEELRHKASVRTREVVAGMRADGLSVRDVGRIIGLSPQRVSQLANSTID